MPNERAAYRQPTQESDLPVIGAFGGLSSASYSTTGNITHQQKLVNAYINKRNEITRRQGSSLFASVQNLTNADAPLVGAYLFTFDNQQYGVYRNNLDLVVFTFTPAGFISDTKVKTGIFSIPNEETNFSVVVENDNCFVLCASRSSSLAILCLLKRDVNVLSLATPTTPVLSISNYPINNVVTSSKLFLFDTSNTNVPVTSATQVTFTFSLVTAVPFVNAVLAKPRVHLCFACRGISAAYYPGNYFYNTAVRKNLVPLDVNMRIPDELASNPLLTESTNQNLSLPTTFMYKNNGASPAGYTRVVNNTPATADEYDFGDGSYRTGVSIKTVRTPNYFAFGGLQTPTDDTRAFIFRMRSITSVLPTYFAALSRLSVYLDKSLFNAIYYDANGTLVTNDSSSVSYISVHATSNPGIPLGSVVEIFFRSEPSVVAANIVDLTRTNNGVYIDDYYSIPIYGLCAIANVGGSISPNIVQTVGNRVVLTGVSNRLLVSSSNWDYRGMGWNNFQVSSINFGENSAYLLTLTQSTSIIKSVSSVNGVLIIGTDSGVYRVSGANPTTVPNATAANVSRISNEVVSNQRSAIVYNNKVYYVSRNGLYVIEFAQDNQELNATPVSAEVSDYFTNNSATSITYSAYYRAFIIGFDNLGELLVYFLESDTFATFSITSNGMIKVIPSLDGYQLTIPTTSIGLSHVLYCRWDNSGTDISNAATDLPALSNLVPRSQTFTEVPQDNTLVTPAEVLDTTATNIVQSYGKNTARALLGNVTVYEGTANNQPLAIISAFVTKAFSSSKMIGANRVRGVSLLCSGSGAAIAKVIYQSADYNNHLPDPQPFAIDSTSGYSGESLLNYRYYDEQSAVGDNINVRIKVSGVSEAWELGLVWSGTLKIIGYQFDTSSKRRARLR